MYTEVCRTAVFLLLSLTTSITAFGQTPPARGKVQPAPVRLNVVSATRTQVRLSWSALGNNQFRVERKPYGTATWVAVGGAARTGLRTGTSLSDATISPQTTYVYRVVKLPESQSKSNEVTVGPPAPGFTSVYPVPAARPTEYARFVGMTTDQNGDPLIAFIHHWQTGTGNHADTLYVLRWDRATFRWYRPLILDDNLADLEDSDTDRKVVMARDSQTGAVGILYRANHSTIRYAESRDNGVTWQTRIASDTENPHGTHGKRYPSLAMHADTVHIAYYESFGYDSETPCYFYATRAPGSDHFTYQMVPLPARAISTRGASPTALALDSRNRPGLLFGVLPTDATGKVLNEYNRTIAYWRPGSPDVPVTVMDSLNQQTDDPSWALTYHNTSPRVSALLNRTASDGTTGGNLWWSSSPDGMTWSAPTLLPRDRAADQEGDNPLAPLSLALDSMGRAHITTGVGAGDGSNRFGQPKIVYSPQADYRGWSVTGGERDKQRRIESRHPATIMTEGNTLYIAFYALRDGVNSPVRRGIWLWRRAEFTPPPSPIGRRP